LRIEIKSAQEWSTLEKARQDCVVTSSLYSFRNGTKWAAPDWAVMVWESGDLVCNVHILQRSIQVGNESLLVGGIGNVATKVEWRKRGYATAALKVATHFLLDPLGVDFGLMITSEQLVPAYERRGWSLVTSSMLADQPDGKITLSYPIMIFPVKKDKWPEGTIDLCGLPW
jgi:aminoglycoside 2'-N-acetyltransferase I